MPEQLTTEASDAIRDLGQVWAYRCAESGPDATGGPEGDDCDGWDDWHDGPL